MRTSRRATNSTREPTAGFASLTSKARRGVQSNTSILLISSIDPLVRLRCPRYYHTDLQRFISEDPVGFMGGDFNLYALPNNRPTVMDSQRRRGAPF